MMLTGFIIGLLQGTGTVVANQIQAFEDDDVRSAITIIQQYYTRDILEMPGTAPVFCPEAAGWSAQYLYRMIQLMLLRHVEKERIQELLPACTVPLSPELIYSADLVLRYLPDVFSLAKSLSPEDPLVKQIVATAVEWPFSSVGIPLPIDPDLGPILSHSSLQRAYIDRIIDAKDITRCNTPFIHALVQEALGNYPEILWQEFPAIKA